MFTFRKIVYSSLSLLALCASLSAAPKESQGILLCGNTLSECRIDVNNAKIQVKCVKGVQPKLTYHPCTCGQCRFTAHVSGNTLVVKHQAKKESPCSVDLDLIVPPSCNFEIEAKSQLQLTTSGDVLGDVTIAANRGTIAINTECKNCRIDSNRCSFECTQKIQGNLKIDGNRADIKVTNVGGNVDIDTNRGSFKCTQKIQGSLNIDSNRTDVNVADVGGNVELDANKGTLLLTYLTIPAQPVKIDIKVNEAAITLSLPKNAHVLTDIKVDEATIQDHSEATGPVHFSIKASLKAGNLSINH